MEPTAAPWVRKPGGDAPPPMGVPTAGLRGAAAAATGSLPLPPVSRGELTRAPWAAASGPALTGRPVEAAVPHAQPRLPPLAAEDFSSHRFLPPAKRIHTPEQLKQFVRSGACRGGAALRCSHSAGFKAQWKLACMLAYKRRRPAAAATAPCSLPQPLHAAPPCRGGTRLCELHPGPERSGEGEAAVRLLPGGWPALMVCSG